MEQISIDDAAARLASPPERVLSLIADGTLLALGSGDTRRVLVDQVFLCGEKVAALDEDGDPVLGGPGR
jgi:hypothetical protein